MTVAAAQDDDGAHGEALITHIAAGAEYANVESRVTATEIDDDPLGLSFSPAVLTVREGESASYSVALATRPLGDVSIAVSSDDETLTVMPATLDFAPDAYDAPQTVTVAAADPEQAGEDRSATLTHAASGGDYGEVAGVVAVQVVADRRPSFAAGVRIADQSYTQYREIDPLILPEATGGDGSLTYALTSAPPAGLVFDADTRTLSGTPTAVAPSATYTYEAADADTPEPDRVSLTFSIVVVAAPKDDGLEDALAAQGRAILTSATGAVGERFRRGAAPAEHCGDDEREDGEGRREDCASQAFSYIARSLAAAGGGVYPGGFPGATFGPGPMSNAGLGGMGATGLFARPVHPGHTDSAWRGVLATRAPRQLWCRSWCPWRLGSRLASRLALGQPALGPLVYPFAGRRQGRQGPLDVVGRGRPADLRQRVGCRGSATAKCVRCTSGRIEP